MDEFLAYYQRELAYLREEGREFSRKYPRVAHRLELGADEVADPHVERLVESFAFLTARLQQNVEDQFPEIPEALLGTVYPQFTCPVPSMAVVRFIADKKQGNLTEGYRIPRGQALFVKAPTAGGSKKSIDEGRLVCKFKTCYDATLWPFELEQARLEDPDQHAFLDNRSDVTAILRLRLKCVGSTLKDIDCRRLRFYLNGHGATVYSMYERLCADFLELAVRTEGQDFPVAVPGAVVNPVGFEQEKEVLPYPPNAHDGFRLLAEYMAFPEKFLFVDVEGITYPRLGQRLELFFLLRGAPPDISVDKSNFVLGCTPIINLFEKTTEPVKIDHRKAEYRLNPDLHRERVTEIHSIKAVEAISEFGASVRRVAPFFSHDHDMSARGQRTYWYARRRRTKRADLPGTDLYLSFLDLDFDPRAPDAQTVYAHVRCTNRDLAWQVPAGAQYQLEEAAPVARIVGLSKPTKQLDPPMDGATLWRLVSHLSLNYLSIIKDKNSVRGLRELLRLYNPDEKVAAEKLINGIRDVSSRTITRRLGKDSWRGFVHGIEICLTVDESMYVGSSLYLFGSVLSRFFGLYAPLNSFTQLTISKQGDEGCWKRWPPRVGQKELL